MCVLEKNNQVAERKSEGEETPAVSTLCVSVVRSVCLTAGPVSDVTVGCRLAKMEVGPYESI